MWDFIAQEVIRGLINAGFVAIGGTITYYIIRKIFLREFKKTEAFKNVTKLIKELSGEDEAKLKMPKKEDKSIS